MKKVGLSLSKEIYDYIEELANKNNTTPTTICRLIIESRVDFYKAHNLEVKFTQKFIEQKIDHKIGAEVDDEDYEEKKPWLER